MSNVYLQFSWVPVPSIVWAIFPANDCDMQYGDAFIQNGYCRQDMT